LPYSLHQTYGREMAAAAADDPTELFTTMVLENEDDAIEIDLDDEDADIARAIAAGADAAALDDAEGQYYDTDLADDPVNEADPTPAEISMPPARLTAASQYGHPNGALHAALQRVQRPVFTAAAMDATDTATAVEFQMNHVDVVVAKPRLDIPLPPYAADSATAGDFSPEDEVPVVRLFGSTANGQSVLVRVHGFEPYFFCTPPAGVNPDSPEQLEELRMAMDNDITQSIIQDTKNKASGNKWAKAAPAKRQAWGKSGASAPANTRGGGDDYQQDEPVWPIVTAVRKQLCRPLRTASQAFVPLLRVTTRLPRHVPMARKVTERCGCTTFEASVAFDLRFMIDKHIAGCDWVSINLLGAAAAAAPNTPPPPAAPGSFMAGVRYHVGDALHVHSESGQSTTWAESVEERIRQYQKDGLKRAVTEAIDGVADVDMMGSAGTAAAAAVPVPADMAIGKDYVVRPKRTELDESRCQIEIDAWHGDVHCLGNAGNYAAHAPMRVLSFDIECAPIAPRFPDAALGDPVITICSRMTMEEDAETAAKNRPGDVTCNKFGDVGVAFQLRSCDPVNTPGVRTVWFDDERALLMAWHDLIVQYDPDIITGFNTPNFDFPYLLKRAELLGIGKRFADLGRVRGELMQCRKSAFSSKGSGVIENNELKITGRLVYDVRQVAQRSIKLPTYSLNAVASLIGMQKLEMDHHELPKLFFHGSATDRSRICLYCDQDSALPLAIGREKMFFINAIEMARATHTPMAYELARGQQIRALSLLLNDAALSFRVVDSSASRDSKTSVANQAAKYEGATVLDPKKGLHDETVVTLDFNSLYPSIMISHNYDYTTIVEPDQIHLYHPDNLYKSPIGIYFLRAPPRYKPDDAIKAGVPKAALITNPDGSVSIAPGSVLPFSVAETLKLKIGSDYTVAGAVAGAAAPATPTPPGTLIPTPTPSAAQSIVVDSEKRLGLLPNILMGLLSRRSATKKLMNAESDPVRKAVYDGRQLALKLVANSIYGFTGTKYGLAPEWRIAASVTSKGRELIEFTKQIVESHFRCENGYPADAKVIYGDTDSVMVTFRPEIPVGAEAASIAVTTTAATLVTALTNPTAAEPVKPSDCLKKFVECGWRCRCSQPVIPVTTDPVRAAELQTAIKISVADAAAQHLTEEFGVVPATASPAQPQPPPTPTPLATDAPARTSARSAWVRKTIPKVSTPTEVMAEADACSDKCVEALLDILAHSSDPDIARAAANQTIRTNATTAARNAIDLLVVNRAAIYGKEACKMVSSRLPPPLNIEFEKVFGRFLLGAKKRYAGVKFVEIRGVIKPPDSVSTMGIETSRRDGCPLQREVLTKALYDILIAHDPKRAVATTRQVLAGIAKLDFPMDKFIITKALSKAKTEFSTKQAHVELADSLRRRGDPRYNLGDRVRMVIAHKDKKAKTFEKGEDPYYAAQHSVLLDIPFYTQKQIIKPLRRIFECLVPDNVDAVFDHNVPIEQALAGKYNRLALTARPTLEHAASKVPSSAPGSIGNFLAVLTKHCLLCKTAIVKALPESPEEFPALCAACFDKEGALKTLLAERKTEHDRRLAEINKHCTACVKQRSTAATTAADIEDTIKSCVNDECPMTFARIMTTNRLQELARDMKRPVVYVAPESIDTNDPSMASRPKPEPWKPPKRPKKPAALRKPNPFPVHSRKRKASTKRKPKVKVYTEITIAE